MLPWAGQQTSCFHPTLPIEQPDVLRVAAHLELRAHPARLARGQRQATVPRVAGATSSEPALNAGQQVPGTFPCEA